MILFTTTIITSITLGFAIGYHLGWLKHQNAINEAMINIRDPWEALIKQHSGRE